MMETVANTMENSSVLEKSIYDIGGEDLMDFWKEELVVPFNNVKGQSNGRCGTEEEEAACTPPNDDYYKFMEHGYISNSSTTDSPNGYLDPAAGMYAVSNELLTDFYEREQAVRDGAAAFSWSRNFSFAGAAGASLPEVTTAVKGEHSYSFGVKHPGDLNGTGPTHLGPPGLVPGPAFSIQLADVPGNQMGVASSGGTSLGGSEDSLPDSPLSSVQDGVTKEAGYSAKTITSLNRSGNQSDIPTSAYQEKCDQDVIKQHCDEGADAATANNSSRRLQPVSVQDVRSSSMLGTTSSFTVPHGRLVIPSGGVNIQVNAKSTGNLSSFGNDGQSILPSAETSFHPNQVTCKELSTMLAASCSEGGIIPYPEYTVAPSGNYKGKNLNARIMHNWYGFGDDQSLLHVPKPSMTKKSNVMRSCKPDRRVARHPIKTPLISTQPKGAIGPLHLTNEEKRTLISEGYPVPEKLPLTKSEEKSLKKIRRKIKNKISAQESRRKKKDYMDRLERKMDRLAHDVVMYKNKCSTLESQNASLIQHIKSMKAQLAAVEKK